MKDSTLFLQVKITDEELEKKIHIAIDKYIEDVINKRIYGMTKDAIMNLEQKIDQQLDNKIQDQYGYGRGYYKIQQIMDEKIRKVLEEKIDDAILEIFNRRIAQILVAGVDSLNNKKAGD